MFKNLLPQHLTCLSQRFELIFKDGFVLDTNTFLRQSGRTFKKNRDDLKTKKFEIAVTKVILRFEKKC